MNQWIDTITYSIGKVYRGPMTSLKRKKTSHYLHLKEGRENWKKEERDSVKCHRGRQTDTVDWFSEPTYYTLDEIVKLTRDAGEVVDRGTKTGIQYVLLSTFTEFFSELLRRVTFDQTLYTLYSVTCKLVNQYFLYKYTSFKTRDCRASSFGVWIDCKVSRQSMRYIAQVLYCTVALLFVTSACIQRETFFILQAFIIIIN